MTALLPRYSTKGRRRYHFDAFITSDKMPNPVGLLGCIGGRYKCPRKTVQTVLEVCDRSLHFEGTSEQRVTGA